MEVIEACTLNTRRHAFETKLHHFVIHAHCFKELRATIASYSANTHLRHDLIQAFIDTLTVVQRGLHGRNV